MSRHRGFPRRQAIGYVRFDHVGNECSYKARIWGLAIDRKERSCCHHRAQAEGVSPCNSRLLDDNLNTLDWKSFARKGLGESSGRVSSENMQLRQWTLATGKQDQVWTMPPSRLLLTLAPDGKTIIMPNDDGSIIDL